MVGLPYMLERAGLDVQQGKFVLFIHEKVNMRVLLISGINFAFRISVCVNSAFW